jgi:hypothetical protein
MGVIMDDQTANQTGKPLNTGTKKTKNKIKQKSTSFGTVKLLS